MLYEGLQKAAEKKGWNLQGASLLREVLTAAPIVIEGNEDGVPIQLHRASALHTFATNAFITPPIVPPFEITTEGVTGAIASALGVEDVKVGDEDFDAAFRLVSKDPAALRKILTPAVRTVVKELALEAQSFGTHFRVTEHVVWLQRPHWGTMTEEDVLRDVPLCVRVVKAFEAAARAAG
jgi:hypothetical protein